jgi:hypothetical protein
VLLLERELSDEKEAREKLAKDLHSLRGQVSEMRMQMTRWWGFGAGVLAVGAFVAWLLAGAADATEAV